MSHEPIVVEVPLFAPLSQSSPGPLRPSPQTLSRHFEVHAAASALFAPLSHCSPTVLPVALTSGFTLPSPQLAVVQS